MIYANNINHMQKSFPNLYGFLQKITSQGDSFYPESTKNGELNVRYLKAERPVYIHSRQDPLEEARRWVSSQLKEGCMHVVFYGFGCGYFVQALLEINPSIKISIYEPSAELFKIVLEHRPIDKLLNKKNIDVLAFENGGEQDVFIGHVVSKINSETQLMVLPSYKRVFLDDLKRFEEKLFKSIESYKASLGMNARAEARWILNSLRNFETVVNTPNIFTVKDEFVGKPFIVVAAGPSLENEYENLRVISRKNMAYIFAVGSATYGLIANGILPHAFCSYDPWSHNEHLFAKLQRNDLPLIFGTSIFSGTLKHFAGQKFHMVISQDTISPYLTQIEPTSIIQDAPSIAICVLQLAHKFGCSPIILVGQDLGYPRGRFYAKGIDYYRKEQLSEKEINRCIKVKSVDGSLIYTENSWDRTRQSLEYLLRQYGDSIIINTSPEGAKIEGTLEKPLIKVMEEYLSEDTINPCWYKTACQNIDIEKLYQRINQLNRSMDNFKVGLKILHRRLDKLGEYSYIKRIVDNEYKKLLIALSALEKNDYYIQVIGPMIRAEIEVLQKFLPGIEQEVKPDKKAKALFKYFTNIINKMEHRLSITENIVKDFKNIPDKLKS